MARRQNGTIGTTRAILIFLTLAVLNMCVGLAVAHGEDAWMSLFNGKDLSGWHPNVRPESWSVEDGVIKAQATKPYSHLFYVGESEEGQFTRFEDFVLELEVRTEPGANGGIKFHTDLTSTGKRNALVKGHELQICSSEHEKRKTGSLYRVVDLAKSPVDETKWFEVRLTVHGKRIMIEMDEDVVVDYTEPEDVKGERRLFEDGGAVALQAHDPESIVYYRSIRIKRL